MRWRATPTEARSNSTQGNSACLPERPARWWSTTGDLTCSGPVAAARSCWEPRWRLARRWAPDSSGCVRPCLGCRATTRNCSWASVCGWGVGQGLVCRGNTSSVLVCRPRTASPSGWACGSRRCWRRASRCATWGARIACHANGILRRPCVRWPPTVWRWRVEFVCCRVARRLRCRGRGFHYGWPAACCFSARWIGRATEARRCSQPPRTTPPWSV